MAGLFLLGAAAYAADSKITMVTYFPTPYMAYQDVTVSGPCDMGLINDCRLTVAKDLQVDSMSVGEGSTLTLKERDAQANALKSGQGSASRGSLVFEGNLTVGTLPGQVKALETEKGTLTKLNLGSKEFPTCNATGNKISWKNLTINNQEGIYLVCGDGDISCNTAPPACKVVSNGMCMPKVCRHPKTLDTSTCECSIPSVSCDTTAPACEVEKNGSCVKKTCSGNKTLDTTDCTCKEDDGDLQLKYAGTTYKHRIFDNAAIAPGVGDPIMVENIRKWEDIQQAAWAIYYDWFGIHATTANIVPTDCIKAVNGGMAQITGYKKIPLKADLPSSCTTCTKGQYYYFAWMGSYTDVITGEKIEVKVLNKYRCGEVKPGIGLAEP